MMQNDENTLWDADFSDTEVLKKVAVATPENYRMYHPENPLVSSIPDFQDMLPLVANARKELENRGVDWRPKREVAIVERPIETPEQHLDSILNAAAARMTAPRGRRK